MKTLPKPEITCRTMEIKLPKYQELLMMEKKAIPELKKQLEEADRLKRESYVAMMRNHRKLKWGVWHEQQHT